jgi:malonate transporter
MTIHVILLALAPVFFVIALGYMAGKLRVIDNHHLNELNVLIMDFALPASLLVATSSTSRTKMLEQVPLFAILTAVMLTLYLFWYLVERKVSRSSRGEAAVVAISVAVPNYAAVGLPIVSAILGPTETVPVAIAIAAASILPSPLTLLLLELSRDKDHVNTGVSYTARALRAALVKPIVLAPLLGILLSLSELELHPVANASLLLIGQAASGGALFLTGLILSAQPFELDWQTVGATATANLMRPLLAITIVKIAPVPSEVAKVVVLLAALPSGFFGILFGVRYGLNPAKAGSVVITSTVLSSLTLAGAIAFLYPQ